MQSVLGGGTKGHVTRWAESTISVRDLALEHAPDTWWAWVNAYHYMYCKRWSVK